MSLVKVAVRCLGSSAPSKWAFSSARGLRRLVFLVGMACGAGLLPLPVQGAPTISDVQMRPQCRQAPINAVVDGTSRSLFIFTATVSVPTNERIDGTTNWDFANPPTYTPAGGGPPVTSPARVTIGGFPAWRVGRGSVASADYGRGGGVYRTTIPGWYMHSDDDGLPALQGWTSVVATTRSTTTPPADPMFASDDMNTPTWRVTGRGREVLIPVDAGGISDQFKTPKKAGGIEVNPGDPARYGDGSASATYTFRVKYIDPEGLPPKPNNWPYNVNDEIGPGTVEITTGVENDQYNVPRRLDDPWRFPTPTDPVLPAGVAPVPYRCGVYIVFDDNNDGQIRTDPVWWTNVTDVPSQVTVGDAPHLMVIDTDIPSQQRFLASAPAAQDWMNGVIFKYTARPTDNAVAVGIPRFFDFGNAVYQFLVSPFAMTPGQKYVNVGRSDALHPPDPTARSFVSLQSGLRRYTYLASNDIMYYWGDWYNGIGYSNGFGYWPNRDPLNPGPNFPYSDPTMPTRYFQQPNLNAPMIDPQSPPRQVFLPPFEIRVDPQITVEQRQLRRDPDPPAGITEMLLIGIPSAVHGAAIDPATGAVSPVERDLWVMPPDGQYRATPSRFTLKDLIRWRYYYTQSEGVPPTVAELHVEKKDSGGGFSSIAGSPFPCQALATGAAGRDPLMPADPTHLNPFYGQYGTSLVANSSAMGTGVYRYFFRASDGRRAAEWPGDRVAGTGLSTVQWTDPAGNPQTGVNHLANTFRVNTAPTLRASARPAVPTVDPKTGSIIWVVTITYTDADNDPPARPFLIFPQRAGTNEGDLVLVMQKANVGDTDYTDGCIYTLQSGTDPTVGAFGGRRDYYFSFTDNWKAPDNPEPGEDVRDPVGTQGTGSMRFLNSQPFLLNGSVTKASGSLGDNYTFSVSYGDNENDPPLEVNGVPQVRLYIDDKPTDFYLRTDNASPDFTRGVVYTVSVSGRQIGPGPHTFKISARDRYDMAAASDATGTGPSIDTPVLTEGAVQAVPDLVGGGTVVGYPLTDFVFRVRYRHQSNVPPAYVKVHLLNPGTGAAELAEVNLTKEAGQTGTVQTPGLFYSNVDTPFRFGAPGKYQFFFEGSDGESISKLDASGTPIQGPLVAAPVLTPQAPQPAQGVYAIPFEFRVLYTHEGNVPPSAAQGVRLLLVSPKGTQQEVAMSTASQDPAQLRTSGWLYTAKDVSLAETGIYHYSFVVSDGATTVETPLAEGPTSVAVDPPQLSGASVVPAPAIPGEAPKIIYRLTYKQSQRLVPKVMLVADGQVYTMTQESPAGTDIAAGVVYSATADRDLPDGSQRRNYYFLVQAPGIDLRYPESNSVAGPNAIPLLEAPSSGTVAPAQGHTRTTFRFTVRCTDVDATSDPRVSVLVGNQTLPMAKANPGADVRYGADFVLETTLPAGKLSHSFVANDGTDSTRLPGVSALSGPEVLEATLLNATLGSDRLKLDGISAIRVSGATSPAAPSAQISITYQHAGGSKAAQVVAADSAGRFTDRYLPSLAGGYTVTVEYAGDGSSVGGGLQTLAATVDPSTITIPQGRGMYALPLLLPSADLSSVFGAAGYQVARWNGSAYDFGGRSLPGALQAGAGFWLNASTALQATASGPVLDHTQPHAVAIASGWNQVGNPFLSAASWGGVSLETAGGTMTLAQAKAAGLSHDHAWAYEAASSQYVLVHATVPGARRDVAPWQGLWFKSSVAGRVAFAAPSRTASLPGEAERRRERASERQWSIQLVASNGRQMDSYNFAGVSSEGRASLSSGLESPPPMGAYVDLYFAAPGDGGRLATDFRSPSAGEQAWDFVVDTDVTDRAVTVFTPNLSQVPHSLDVFLEDVDAGGKRVYLRSTGGYSFSPGEAGERRFRLVVRPRSLAPLRITDVAVDVTRAGRAISYTVSGDAAVSVRVLSPSMKALKVVADRQAVTAGRSSVLWDGTRHDGARLPAGIYVVEVTATTSEGLTSRMAQPIVVAR